jgi:glucose-1-phosphate thymidylyltransferase
VTGWWKDTGRPDDLLEANRMMLSTLTARVGGDVDTASRIEGVVVVEPGAKVVRSKLRGPVIVGADATLEDARVGPFVSVGPGCTVQASGVEDSILMAGSVVSRVEGVVERSILGRGVEIRHSGTAGVHRIIAGDLTQVEVD